MYILRNEELIMAEDIAYIEDIKNGLKLTKTEEAKVRNIYKEALAEVLPEYGLHNYVKFNINNRMSRTLAWFVPGDWNSITTIELSGKYAKLALQDPIDGVSEIKDTLKHEIIHYALWRTKKPYEDGTVEFEEALAKFNVAPSGSTKPKDIKSKRVAKHYAVAMIAKEPDGNEALYRYTQKVINHPERYSIKVEKLVVRKG